MALIIDEKLYEFATEKEAEYLTLLKDHDTPGGAEKSLGLGNDTINKALRRLKARAAKAGYAPDHFVNGVAAGYQMRKVTVQRNAHGEVERTWERQTPDEIGIEEFIRETLEAARDEIRPVAPVQRFGDSISSLATLYTFTDYHLGAMCWHKEGGADWDVEIAENLGIAAMSQMVGSAPSSEMGIVNIQGDWMHWDGLSAITPSHGHVLDADSRFGKVVKVSIRLIRHLVALALQHHNQVTLIICEGNHDLASSLWLRNLFAALYEQEVRVTVHDSELPYYNIMWGATMLGFHHGHLSKNASLPALFAAQFRHEWGLSNKVYIHTGHRHHKEEKEHPGAYVIQHPTLAARDAYAARGGWFSERAISAITYHKEFGEVGRVTVTPEMLQ